MITDEVDERIPGFFFWFGKVGNNNERKLKGRKRKVNGEDRFNEDK